MLQLIPATAQLIDSSVRDLLLLQLSEVLLILKIRPHEYGQGQSNVGKLLHAHHLMKDVSADVTFRVNQNERFVPLVLLPDLLSNVHVYDFQLLSDAEWAPYQ